MSTRSTIRRSTKTFKTKKQTGNPSLTIIKFFVVLVIVIALCH